MGLYNKSEYYMRHPGEKDVIVYTLPSGKKPVREWLDNMKDAVTRLRIWSRLSRLALGHYGDCKSVGDGVYELRLAFGPGYRIYFGEIGQDIIILLCGGDKSTQEKDIQKAKIYFQRVKGEHHEQKSIISERYAKIRLV